MKKLIRIILVTGVILGSYYGYKAYKRAHLPEGLLIEKNSNIDVEYHNASDLLSYTNIRYKLNAITRQVWYDHLEPINSEVCNDPSFVEKQLEYKELKELYSSIEKRLVVSLSEKKKGRTNGDIKYIEDNFPKEINQLKTKTDSRILFQYGDVSDQLIDLQKRLNQVLETKIPADGIYLLETENTIKEFQKNNQLDTTGKIDIATYMLILGLEQNQNR
jgi:hypothetical protein